MSADADILRAERDTARDEVERLEHELDHADAVAAKLVEVIVRDAIEISNLHGEIKQGVADWYAMKVERDTARDEVERLGAIVREQDEHAIWMRQCWKAVAEERDEARADAIVATRERRAEVAVLREQLEFVLTLIDSGADR